MTDPRLRCQCPEAGKAACEKRATQEDLLCDHCRRANLCVAITAAGREFGHHAQFYRALA